MPRQRTNTILMVRPAVFWSNPETALTNEFQRPDLPSRQEQTAVAQQEFDQAVTTLRAAGVSVTVINDTAVPEKPDAIFPNNWLTTHDNGACVMYPMQPESRRAERRPEIVQQIKDAPAFNVRQIIDWSGFEASNRFLEGTGSMVLDRRDKLVYACWSKRTHEDVLKKFCDQFGYTAITFNAAGPSGTPIYHTNVMMCIGQDFAVICDESITDPAQRQTVIENLERGREIIPISIAQMQQFAGNMLELENQQGDSLLVMSTRARDSLDANQHNALAAHTKIVACDVGGIEDSAGGSIRCMIAELFVPA